jgi:protein-tyrosine phosphatase
VRIWLPSFIESYLDDNYGSKKGFLKYYYHKVLQILGFYNKYSIDNLDFIPNRYVFVCAGNICRSPLAEVVAKNAGVNSISFGLDTRGGDPADPRAIEFASSVQLDLTKHNTTKASKYIPEKGDVIVAMEPKHIAMYHLTAVDVPIVLLGMSNNNKKPFIHDPYCTNDVFFKKVEALVVEFTKILVRYGKS